MGRYESVAETACSGYLSGTHRKSGATVNEGLPPLLVIAATGIDALRIDLPAAASVDLFDDGELKAAAEWAGLIRFDLNSTNGTFLNGTRVDMVFTDDAGIEVATANVKIAASADVIVRHLDRYPDIGIVYATSDAATDAAGDAFSSRTPLVIDVGRTAADLDRQIADILTSADTLIEDGAHGVEAFNLVP